WYFAAAVIMAIAVAAFYIAVQAYPDSLGGAAWPGLLVSVLLLAGAVFRLRVTDSPMARAERAALAAAAGLSLLTVALQPSALAVPAFCFAVQAYPASLGGAAWPGLLVSVLLLAGAVFRLRVTDSPMARAERAALAAAAGLSLLTVALQAFVLADGLSVWAVV